MNRIAAAAAIVTLAIVCAGCTGGYVPVISDVEVAPIRAIESTEDLFRHVAKKVAEPPPVPMVDPETNK